MTHFFYLMGHGIKLIPIAAAHWQQEKGQAQLKNKPCAACFISAVCVLSAFIANACLVLIPASLHTWSDADSWFTCNFLTTWDVCHLLIHGNAIKALSSSSRFCGCLWRPSDTVYIVCTPFPLVSTLNSCHNVSLCASCSPKTGVRVAQLQGLDAAHMNTFKKGHEWEDTIWKCRHGRLVAGSGCVLNGALSCACGAIACYQWLWPVRTSDINTKQTAVKVVCEPVCEITHRTWCRSSEHSCGVSLPYQWWRMLYSHSMPAHTSQDPSLNIAHLFARPKMCLAVRLLCS